MDSFSPLGNRGYFISATAFIQSSTAIAQYLPLALVAQQMAKLVG